MKKTISLILGAVLCLSLLAACGTPAAQSTPSPTPMDPAQLAEHYKEAIIAGRTDEDNEYNTVATTEEETGTVTWDVLGLSVDQLDAYAVSVSLMNVKAYCVGLFKPASGQEEAVSAALQTYLDNTENSFSTYLPDQYAIAQSAILKTLDDGTILVVMCENSDTVAEAIEAAL